MSELFYTLDEGILSPVILDTSKFKPHKLSDPEFKITPGGIQCFVGCELLDPPVGSIFHAGLMMSEFEPRCGWGERRMENLAACTRMAAMRRAAILPRGHFLAEEVSLIVWRYMQIL